MARAAIPSYSLYGETGADDGPSFLHIETIAARSALHDWEIAPHRHQHSIQVLIIERGEVAVALDGSRLDLVGPCHVTIPVAAVHGFRFAPETRGWVLTLGQSFAGRSTGARDPLGALLTGGGGGPIEPAAARRITWLADELLALTRAPHDAGLSLALAEALLRSLPAGGGTAQAEDRRLKLFRHLVETHLAEHQPVSFYAAALGLTERTLSRLCVARLGCTPLEAINRRLAGEATRLLRYTSATVAQVSDVLGFADPSYFSRFYLRSTGRRPSAERSAGQA